MVDPTDGSERGSSPQGVVAGFFPAPISAAFARARGVDDAGRESAYRELHDTLLAYLGSLAWLGSSWERAAEASTAPPSDVSGGQWLSLLCSISKLLSPERHAWVLGPEGGTPGTFGGSALCTSLNEMVRLRNAIVHKYQHELREPWYASIHAAIEQLPHFETHVLIVPRKSVPNGVGGRSYECGIYRGDQRALFVQVECDIELPLNHVLAWDERQSHLLDLHPFVIEARVDAGTLLPELFFADGLRKPSVRGTADGRAAPQALVARVHGALEASADRADPWILAGRLRAPGFGQTRSGPLAPGSVIARRYQILSYLGPGGSADVYAAYDCQQRENVALKMLRVDLMRNHQTRARLRREIELARSIDHPGVVRYLEHGEDHGHAYVTTELAPGWPLAHGSARTLAQWLSAARSEGRIGLDESETRRIGLEIAQGLAELHEHRVVHRDLKPSNVLLFESEGERRVKISDFGIAYETGLPGLTQPGVPHGTAEYMPPEQTDAQQAASTMDVYALGVLLYELLSGEVPFRGKTPQATREAHRRRLEPLSARVPSVSPGFERFVRSCLAKSPRGRPSNGLDAFKRLLALDAPTAVRAVDLMPGRTLGPYAVAEFLEEIPGATLFRASDIITGSSVRLGVLADEVEAGRDRREEALRRLAVLRKLWRASLPLVLNSGEEDGYHWFGVDDSHRGAPTSLRVWLASMHDAAQALLELHASGVGHERVDAHTLVDGKPALGLDLPSLAPTAGFEHETDTRALAERLQQGSARWRAVSRGHESRIAAAAERVIGSLQRQATLLDAQLVSAIGALARLATSQSVTSRARAWMGAFPRTIAATAAFLLLVVGLMVGPALFNAWARRDVRRQADQTMLSFSGRALDDLLAARARLGPDPEIDWRIAMLRIMMPSEHEKAAPPDLSLAPLAHLLRETQDLRQTEIPKYVKVSPVCVLQWAARSLSDPPSPDPREDSVYWFLSLQALTHVTPRLGYDPNPVEDKAMEDYLHSFLAAKRRPRAEPGRSDHATIAGFYARFAVPGGIASLDDPARVREFLGCLLSEGPLPYLEYWLRGCAAQALKTLVDRGLQPRAALCSELQSLTSEARVRAAIEAIGPLVHYRGKKQFEDVRAEILAIQEQLAEILAKYCP